MANAEPPNDQDAFWQGQFGNDYTERNFEYGPAGIALFSRILSRTSGINSIFEIGTNRGLNLDALSIVAPRAKLSGIEINKAAANIARVRHSHVTLGSINDAKIDGGPFDLVFTKGVLIHIAPENLPGIYKRMSDLSSNYVLIVEYYNPTPVEITYRGHVNKLFKRDFAGEFMDATGFRLIDYGFVYRRDPVFPDDDFIWFLMQR